jgi:5S rRNA maturation endonuclease (ribonuclease M5)
MNGSCLSMVIKDRSHMKVLSSSELIKMTGLVGQREPGYKTESKIYTTFAELGISTKRTSGEEKTPCPNCSHKRKKSSEPCLSVNHDEGVFCCHHCEWTGRLSNSNGPNPSNVIYDYCDENGRVLYQKVRAFRKKFWQQTPDGNKNLKGVKRVLYRLPELIKSTGTVFIVGGEKDVETLRKHGLTATTNDNGEGNWRQESNQYFKDRDVIILEDNDEKGKKHGRVVSKSLEGIAKSIKIVKFLELDKGGDVTDFLARHTIDDFHKKVEENEKLGAEWNEQQPLYRSLPKPDAFPIDALGDILGSAVEEMSKIIQAPTAICANSILASTTLALQKHLDIVIDGRISPVSNFFISIGESGERKSAVDRQILKPHYEYQEELRIKYKDELKVYYRKEEAFKRAKDKSLRSSKSYEDNVRTLEKLGEEPMHPLQPFILSEEPTYEGLVKSLELGQASQGLFSDEGGRFIGGHGMNSDNALKTAAGLSGLWDSKSISRMRAGDGSSLLVGRRLSLHLMIQPNIAQMMLSNSMFMEQGLLSRCLCVYPQSTAGTRLYKPINLSASQAMRVYRDKISKILHTPYNTGNAPNELLPKQVELDTEAKHIWQMFHDKVEEQLSENGNLSSIKGLGNKAPEHALRLATVLAGFDAPEISNFSRISRGYIRNSIILVQYYLNEALRLFNSGISDPDLVEANKLLDWLRAKKKTIVSLVELYQRGPNSIRNVKKVRKLMRILIEHGYAIPFDGGVEFEGKIRKVAYEIRL